MADIRINALATTAASTASDDFIAVDGSANGTRKLNAYSPTFGGNLTVSGTDVKINNAAGYFYVDSGSSLTGMLLSRTNNVLELATANNVRLTISAAGNTTLSGNLTVSGTGGVTSSGTTWGFLSNNATQNGYAFYASGASADQKYWHWQNGSAVGDGTLRLRALNDALTNGTNALIITRTGISSTAVEVGGNLTVSGTGNSSVAGTLLVATTTNSSNGKLQLATHTTSAGGIGLGTALSIYRSSDNSAWVDAASGNVQLVLGRAGTANLAVLSDGSNVYASAAQAGMGMIFRTNGSTTALTLDSSQNATFAGKITAGTWASGTAEKLQANTTVNNYAGFFVNTASSGNGYALRLHTNGTTSGDYPLYVSSGAGAGSLIFGVTGDGNATFAGSIRQNQANNISLTSGVATTIFSLGTSAGVYIVTATLDVNAAAGYAIVGKGATGTWQVLANSGTQISFSMSTNDLQITQSSGATSTTNTFNLLRLR